MLNIFINQSIIFYLEFSCNGQYLQFQCVVFRAKLPGRFDNCENTVFNYNAA